METTECSNSRAIYSRKENDGESIDIKKQTRIRCFAEMKVNYIFSIFSNINSIYLLRHRIVS